MLDARLKPQVAGSAATARSWTYLIGKVNNLHAKMNHVPWFCGDVELLFLDGENFCSLHSPHQVPYIHTAPAVFFFFKLSSTAVFLNFGHWSEDYEVTWVSEDSNLR